MIKYTDEMRQFFADYIPGHHHKETAEEFTRRFGIEIAAKTVNSYAKRYGIKTGFTGCFGKENAGFRCPKGYHIPGSEKGWFKKGNIPPNYRPVGSERITKDGYIEIKIKDPRTWRLKHLVVWEAQNGPIGEDDVVIFKDNDKTNCSIDNLMKIKRAELLKMNQIGIGLCSAELKETAVIVAKVSLARGQARRKANDEKNKR